MIEQAKFTDSCLEKALEKQIKMIEGRGKKCKQLKSMENNSWIEWTY